MMNLRTLVEKTPDPDLLRQMIGFAGERLMELEVESQTGAAYGEKPPSVWPSAMAIAPGCGETRAGAVELRIPKLRKGYQLEKDQFIEVTKEELEEIALESTRTIEIDAFVDKRDIAAGVRRRVESRPTPGWIAAVSARNVVL